ncbi:MAG: type II toxin-antitoxin system VapC family toxin [Armatimonadetes bacterium]|nr:type II toxin-antitoxin system VapC family toxin [Armatimonadota bacterium]
MILLDTNVLSEFMRPQPAACVVAWLDAQAAGEVCTSAVSRAEIELGLALMPEGRRRDALSRAAQAMFDDDFAGRCLPFDEVAARHYGCIVSVRARAGRSISVEDAQIAAIAVAHRIPLATRNTTDFELITGLEVVDPWTAGV